MRITQHQSALIEAYEKSARKALALTGWRFAKLFFDAETGRLDMRLVREDNDQTARYVSVRRGSYHGRISISREQVDIRYGLYCGKWYDLCNSWCLGRDSYQKIGHAMLSLAHYISDNPGPDGFVLPAKQAMRAIAGMTRVCEDNYPTQARPIGPVAYPLTTQPDSTLRKGAPCESPTVPSPQMT